MKNRWLWLAMMGALSAVSCNKNGEGAEAPDSSDTDDGPMEKAGEQTDEAAEDTGDAIEEAAEDTEDAVEEAGEDAEEVEDDSD
jgi:hypothetical protein